MTSFQKIKLTVASLMLTTCFTAQTFSLKKGDAQYNSLNYTAAIPYYSKAIKKDSSNTEALGKLADCYRLTNNVKAQRACYGKLVKGGSANTTQKYYYGQTIMESGKPEEAKQYMEQYTADARGAMFTKAINNIKVYYKNEDAYKLAMTTFNSAENDFSPAITSDNKVVFTSARKKAQWINRKHGWTGKNFYYLYSTAKDKDGKYTSPSLFSKNIQTKYNDGPICFSNDGKTVYFTRNNLKGKKAEKSNDGTIKLKIFQATLTQDGKGFENPVELPFNNKEYNCAHPAISADGKKLYFSSDMSGGQGSMDLYVVENIGTAWGTPTNLGTKINTAGNDVFPFITENNILYFSSNGLDGLGGLDIYEVKIKEGVVGKIYNMGAPLNSSNDDFGIVFTKDMKSGYLGSNRNTADLDDNIYSFDVLRAVKRGVVLNVITKDKTTAEILPNTKIKFCDKEAQSNEKGEAQFELEESVDCPLIGSIEKYFDANVNVNTKNISEDVSEINKELLLEKDPGFSLIALVTDNKNKTPLDGVTMKISDENGNVFDYVTSATGDYKSPIMGKKLGDGVKYKLELSKQGYVSKTVDFVKTLDKSGEVKVHEELDLSLGKIEVGGDLAKMIDIKPIYFDVNKFNIRPDAAIELNKIVKIMNEYPNMVVELGSHTDCRAPKVYNANLSDKRAKASAAYIKKTITKPERIFGKGYGESKLKNGCACEGNVKSTCSDAEHQENRRTEFIIVKLLN
jgi:outer membrane protein OmpA-like peptidoglycan-associated protein/tetratricopeptide (TPR) repeat protein